MPSLTLNPIDDKFSIYESDIYQKLGTDTVLLSRFATKKEHSLVCDLGAGQGGLSLLMLIEQPTLNIKGIEIDREAAKIALLNMRHNGFTQQFTIQTGDMRNCILSSDIGRFDAVVSNPPYFNSTGGRQSPSSARMISRCDETCTPAELCIAAGKLLKYGGYFYLVYRCERLVDILSCMRKNNIEPKAIQFIQFEVQSKPKTVLISGRKYGKPSLEVLPPILLKH